MDTLNLRLTSSSSGASTIPTKFEGQTPDADYLVRRLYFGNEIVEQTASTENFVRRYLIHGPHHQHLVRYLGEAIDSLKMGRDYDGHYIAHLLGEIDESEFEQLSLEFVQEIRSIDLEELKGRLTAILANTQSEFTVAEMAELLGSPEEDVVSAIDAIAMPNASSSIR